MEAETEITLKEVKYRIGRLNPRKQFHLSRRMAPFILALGKGAGSASSIKEGGDTLSSMVQVFGPISQLLSEMPDDQVDYILTTCLSVVTRETGNGWARVQASNGELMFQELGMDDLIQLTMAVLKENLGNFFKALPGR